MHQKKSEAEIGKENSSDYKSYYHSINQNHTISYIKPIQKQTSTAPYKRPSHTQSHSPSHTQSPTPSKPPRHVTTAHPFPSLSVTALRRHLRHVLLLSLPFFCFLHLLSAFAFSAALLLSLSLAAPRLPSLGLFLSRFLSLKPKPRPVLPVFWTLGARTKTGQAHGLWVVAYANGDVYEGEFEKGKCWGSGVYYYSMSGRYEGDWVDGKYDGFGVETWARGSRYRGQYRHGLRHGFGVYRFYSGDVYAGEWANGQSHGCGVHTCEDGSRYVGEFKWGVKHALGHYHFRVACG